MDLSWPISIYIWHISTSSREYLVSHHIKIEILVEWGQLCNAYYGGGAPGSAYWCPNTVRTSIVLDSWYCSSYRCSTDSLPNIALNDSITTWKIGEPSKVCGVHLLYYHPAPLLQSLVSPIHHEQQASHNPWTLQGSEAHCMGYNSTSIMMLLTLHLSSWMRKGVHAPMVSERVMLNCLVSVLTTFG